MSIALAVAGRTTRTIDATINVQIYPNVLTDGSMTFDVHLINNDTGDCIKLHAYSQADALRLARTVTLAINECTCDLARCPH